MLYWKLFNDCNIDIDNTFLKIEFENVKKIFDKIYTDLLESLFSLHTEGFIHNNISLLTIFYDSKIMSWVLSDFANATNTASMLEMEDD